MRSEATLADAPEEVGVNDEAVLAMLADPKALRLRDSPSSLRATLAVPMANRGELFGFVLLGGGRTARRTERIRSGRSNAQRASSGSTSTHCSSSDSPRRPRPSAGLPKRCARNCRLPWRWRRVASGDAGAAAKELQDHIGIQDERFTDLLVSLAKLRATAPSLPEHRHFSAPPIAS